MALVHITLTDIYGASATKTGAHPNTVLSMKPAELGIAGNVSDALALSPEGALLSLLQAAYTNQGNNAARVMEITRSTPIITTRGGDNVRGERYVVTIYSGAPVDIIDPDTI